LVTVYRRVWFAADDRFIFFDGTGAANPSLLYYDSDGGSAANRILLAVIENGATLTAADVVKF